MKINLSTSQWYSVFHKLQGSTLGQPSKQAGLATLTGSTSRSNSQLSSIELEKHIKDYKSGYGKISSQTASKVKNEDNLTNDMLSFDNPSLSRLYQSYQTGFTYSQKSRYVNSLNTATKSYKMIQDIQTEAANYVPKFKKTETGGE